MNAGEAIRWAADELSEITDCPSLEAQLMIQKVTGLSRPVLLSHPERKLTDMELSAFKDICAKRSTGFPLPYILGEWEFFGHSFLVDPSILIPRPETELLVEEAEAWLKLHPDIRHAFDIGTGSGCIAISLLLDHPGLNMTAVDIQRAALRTAVRNAEMHHCRDRFHPVQANLFAPFRESADLICANLPYIPTETCKTIEPARFEPISALDGGEDGFDLYRLLFQQIQNKMKGESLILCEIEYRQRNTAFQTAKAFFPDSCIEVMNDLAGLPRLLKIINRK